MIVSTQIYRAAIVGCGRKAATLDDEDRCRINYSIPPDTHAGAYRVMPNVRLVAAADPNEAKRRVMRERWGIEAVYADYREMLARERPDLVSVTTRAPRHGEVTIAAATAGVKGVLCEKAMATSLHEADAMIEACRRSGTKLMINYTRRWHPTYVSAARLLVDGSIGALRCVIGICPAPLIHNGTHLLDLMRYFGGNVASISGEIHPIQKTGCAQPASADPTPPQLQKTRCTRPASAEPTPPQHAAEDIPGRAMLLYQSGAVGFADIDSSLGFGIELQGESGRILIDSAADGLTMWQYQAPASPSSERAWYQGGPCKERTVRQVRTKGSKGTLICALEELIACIEHDRESTSSGQDGRAALELALAVHQSHASGGARIVLPLHDRAFAVDSR